MDRLPGVSQPAESRVRSPDAQLAVKVDECGRGIEIGDRTKCTVGKFEQDAELGGAESHGILQHGLKHRLKFARRRADDAQHLRESLPLFPRLLKLVCLALEFFLQIDKRMAAARWYRRAGIGVLVAFHLSRPTTT